MKTLYRYDELAWEEAKKRALRNYAKDELDNLLNSPSLKHSITSAKETLNEVDYCLEKAVDCVNSTIRGLMDKEVLERRMIENGYLFTPSGNLVIRGFIVHPNSDVIEIDFKDDEDLLD
jgi:coenzyme F420-reducing hydrogenase alpha subunit